MSRGRRLVLSAAGTLVLGAMLLAMLLRHPGWRPTIDDWRNDIEAISSAPSDSAAVLQHLQQNVLQPPSQLSYNLDHDTSYDPSDGQAAIIDQLLGGKRNGFFVECGAFTGDVLSNSLFFETQRSWRGLLIEPDDSNFQKLKSKNRKAHLAHGCLAQTDRFEYSPFEMRSHSGRIVDGSNASNDLIFHYDSGMQMAQCFPLISFLLALNVTTVDYFSLDVESSEYKVLSSIPWGRLDIKTLSVEYTQIPEGREALVDLLESLGYVHYAELNTPVTHDYIFEKKSVISTAILNQSLPILVNDFKVRYRIENSPIIYGG